MSNPASGYGGQTYLSHFARVESTAAQTLSTNLTLANAADYIILQSVMAELLPGI